MRRRRNSRYTEIALTYTRPWYMRLWGAFIGWFVFASILFQRKIDYGGQMAYLMIGGSIAAWGGAIIAGHLKEQLADARARVTPSFVAPHLVVAAIVFALGVIGFASFAVAQIHGIPVGEGLSSLQTMTFSGYWAMVLLSAAAMAWATHLQSATFIFTAIGAGLLFVTEPGGRMMQAMFSGAAPGLTFGVIAGSLAALAALGWRLAVIHEEMAEYWRMEGARFAHRPQTTGDPRSRRSAFAEAGPLNEFLRRASAFDRVRNLFAAGFFTRVRYWRRVAGSGRLNWVGGAMLIAFLLVMRFVDIKQTKDEQLGVLIVVPLMLSLVLPAIFTITTWSQRWNALAVESLRPVESRGRFLREQGAALALDLAIVWGSITAGVFATALIYHPSWLASWIFAGSVLRSAAAQVWIYATTIWILRYRNRPWLGFITFVGALTAVAVITGRAIDGPRGTLSTPSSLTSAAIVAVSMIISLDAYRRWLKTDFD
jgi:hypothetical protein